MTQQSFSPLDGMTPDELRAEPDRRLSAARELEVQLSDLRERCEAATDAVGEVIRLLVKPPLLDIMEGKR